VKKAKSALNSCFGLPDFVNQTGWFVTTLTQKKEKKLVFDRYIYTSNTRSVRFFRSLNVFGVGGQRIQFENRNSYETAQITFGYIRKI